MPISFLGTWKFFGWVGWSRVLAENSPSLDCPADTTFTPVITRNCFGGRDITPQKGWSWKYGKSPTWAKQSLAKSFSWSEHEHWPDSTGDSGLPSPLQATPVLLDAGMPTSLSKPLANSYVTFREKTFFFFPSRSLSIFLVSPYPLGSAHRMFLSPSYSQKTEKGKEEAFCWFLLAPWCMGMETMKDSFVLEKSSSGTYLTVPRGCSAAAVS